MNLSICVVTFYLLLSIFWLIMKIDVDHECWKELNHAQCSWKDMSLLSLVTECSLMVMSRQETPIVPSYYIEFLSCLNSSPLCSTSSFCDGLGTPHSQSYHLSALHQWLGVFLLNLTLLCIHTFLLGSEFMDTNENKYLFTPPHDEFLR